MQEQIEPKSVWQATVDTSGRVLLPKELGRAMDVEPGVSLIWIRDKNGVHLKSFEQSLAELQNYYQELSPQDVVWSDELIQQRRVEAAHE